MTYNNRRSMNRSYADHIEPEQLVAQRVGSRETDPECSTEVAQKGPVVRLAAGEPGQPTENDEREEWQ